ncbi:hypothetical protein BC833DRAFT_596232 [Globomyces pollinis-pini]|nr:hypothetical protein BC833DRAFT_596232 [Globomyces pollinis-pini]
MPDHLDFVSYFARYSGQQMRMPTSEVIHLQTKVAKWHVNKGPFVHAKSKEVFERKTYRRLVQVFDTHPSTVSQWIKYVNENLPSGVDMQVERFEWKPLDYSMKVPKIQEKKTHAQLILEEEANYLKKFQAA